MLGWTTYGGTYVRAFLDKDYSPLLVQMQHDWNQDEPAPAQDLLEGLDAMNYKYLQVKYGGQWVTLEGGENPHRAYWGQEEPPDDRYIEMPDVPRNEGYAEIAYEVGEFHNWRTSAAGGMGFMRFGQHALQGFLYGLLACLPPLPAASC